MTIKAMHQRHKLNVAMAKFREGLAEMASVDPDNPENNSVGIAVKDLEESVDYWLEEVDRVPEVEFDAGPWKARGDGGIMAQDTEGVVIYVAENVEPHNWELIAGAPALVYAAYKAWRCLEMRDLKEKEREAVNGLADALRGAGVSI